MRITPRDPVLTLNGQWWDCHGRLAGYREGFNGTMRILDLARDFQAHVAAGRRQLARPSAVGMIGGLFSMGRG
jgi:hypothetical protein